MTYQEWRPVWKAGLARASSCLDELQVHFRAHEERETLRAHAGAVATLLDLFHQDEQGLALFAATPEAAAAFVQMARIVDSELEAHTLLRELRFVGETHQHWCLMGQVVSAFVRRVHHLSDW